MREIRGMCERRVFLALIGTQVAACATPAFRRANPLSGRNTPVRNTHGVDMSGHEKPRFNDALAVGRALDLALPDSRSVRDAYELAQAESSPWLFNHVVRSWLYGAKLTRLRALTPDRRFEVVGADAGRAFALSHEMGERRADTIWDAIALHTTGSIARYKGTNVVCSVIGIGCDYGGASYEELSADNKKVILSAYPRLDMKNKLTTCLCDLARNHPDTTRDNFIADFGLKYLPGYTRGRSSVDFLHQAPFEE